MAMEISSVLRDRNAINILLYLHDERVVLKYQLKKVVQGWRNVNKAVEALESAMLLTVEGMSFMDKRFYKVSLSKTGKRVVENLLDANGPKLVAVSYKKGRHDTMLLLIRDVDAITLNDVLRVRRVDDAYCILWELTKLGFVIIERIPGIRILDSRIILTQRGKSVLRKLGEIERLLRDNSILF
jgi:hypothetical protein